MKTFPFNKLSCLNKAFLSLIFVLTFSASFAQNPTVISDSLVIMQRVHAKEELIVDQDATFKGEVHVIGESRFETDVKFDEGVKVGGTAKLESDVQMANLPTLSTLDLESFHVVIKTDNGMLKTMDIGSFFLKGTAPNPPVSCQEIVGGVIVNPGWFTGVDKVYIECPSIRVGIGTSTPQHKLHVTGISYSNRFLGGNPDAITGSTAIFNGFSQNSSQDLIRLGVKIGTADEEVRFKIINDGTVFVKELRVRAIADFPDYVFEGDYKLMSLSELAEFIKVNKHLPNMPTASEVKKGGLAIGDITVRLVEKIEELTLYMIQMDEKMSAMEKRMSELEKENEELKKTK